MNSARNLKPQSFTNPMEFMNQLQTEDSGYEQIAQFVEKVAGLHLPPTSKNKTLVASRLVDFMSTRGLQSYRQLVKHMNQNADELPQLISCLTTNTTHFFREAVHFDRLKQEIPVLLKSEYKSLGEFRLWCAASSIGAEVWTLLMTLIESGQLNGSRLQFLASDIDNECLSTSWKATYSSEQLQAIGAQRLDQFFEPNSAQKPTHYRVKREYRNQVQFANINLIEPFPFSKKFDVIFCRNVLIYFDAATIAQVADKMSQALRPGGLLFVGLSEAGAIKHPLFSSIAPGILKRKEEKKP